MKHLTLALLLMGLASQGAIAQGTYQPSDVIRAPEESIAQGFTPPDDIGHPEDSIGGTAPGYTKE